MKISTLFFGTIIGLLYNTIVHKTADICNSNLNYDDKVQKNLIFYFSGIIIALLFAYTVFCDECNYENPSMRYGLYIGACLLTIHTFIYNWSNMSSDTKYIILLMAFGIVIWGSNKFEKSGSNKFEKK